MGGGGGRGGLIFGLSLLAGPLRAVVFGVDANLWEALLDFGLAFGGRAGGAAQQVGAKRVLTTVRRNSMAVERSLLWVSVKEPFYAAGRSGLSVVEEKEKEDKEKKKEKKTTY